MFRFYLMTILATLVWGVCPDVQGQLIRRNIIGPGGVIDQVRGQVREALPRIIRPADSGNQGTGILRPATPGDYATKPAQIFTARAQLSPNQSVLTNPNVLPGRSHAYATPNANYQPDSTAIYFDARTGQYYYRVAKPVVSELNDTIRQAKLEPNTPEAGGLGISSDDLQEPELDDEVAPDAEPDSVVAEPSTVPALVSPQPAVVDPLSASQPVENTEDKPNYSVLED